MCTIIVYTIFLLLISLCIMFSLHEQFALWNCHIYCNFLVFPGQISQIIQRKIPYYTKLTNGILTRSQIFKLVLFNARIKLTEIWENDVL